MIHAKASFQEGEALAQTTVEFTQLLCRQYLVSGSLTRRSLLL
ncbi:hypothetical protein [Allocoleopsis sp.]